MSSTTIAIATGGDVVAAEDRFPSKALHPRSSSTTTSSTSSESSSDEDAATATTTTTTTARYRQDPEGQKRYEGILREYFDDDRVARMNERARKENESLNLNLGLPADLAAYARRRRDPSAGVVQNALLRPPIRFLIRLLDRLLSFVEGPFFRFWSERVPLRVRQRITFLVWGAYLPVHKALIGRRTGLHRDVSLEYHALTSVMWWGRLFPVTIKRMRFSLSQLHVCHPPDAYPQWSLAKHSSFNKSSNGGRYGIRGHLYEVHHRMSQKRTPTGLRTPTKEPTDEEMTVTGKYIQQTSRPSKKVLFWIYGGAYLAGDSTGNMGIAEKMGMMCATEEGAADGGGDENGMRDVFIPNHRLVPENHLDDAVHDIALAFEYLIYERDVRAGDITLVGVSSGGGLVILLLQALAKAQREFERREALGGSDNDYSSSCVPMPAGGAMLGPFVDYTEPKGTMKEYIKHDLIVNQSVYDEGIPYLKQVLGCHENRVRASPLYGDFEGLPPICICLSEHEVVYDQGMIMAKRAKDQGVDVTVGVWKYMCHVFTLLCPFLPEGKESFNFMCQWIQER